MFPPPGFSQHSLLRDLLARRGQYKTKRRGIAMTHFSGNNRSAFWTPVPINSLNSLHPFLSKQQNTVDNLYDSGMCLSAFRARWSVTSSEVPPWATPELAEQGQALEAVRLELNRADMFLVLATALWWMPWRIWCSHREVSLSCLGYCLWTEPSTGEADGNVTPSSFHVQTWMSGKHYWSKKEKLLLKKLGERASSSFLFFMRKIPCCFSN